MQKAELKNFGFLLFNTLHTKVDGYSLNELICDFRKDNGFDPEEKAKALGYLSLQQLLDSKEMWEHVNVVKRVDENGQRVAIYYGRHSDSLNALKNEFRLSKNELERRQRKKQFQFWQQELNNIPPATPNSKFKQNQAPLFTRRESFMLPTEEEKENFQTFKRNQNFNVSRTRSQGQFCYQNAVPSTSNYLQPKENKPLRRPFLPTSQMSSSNGASTEIVKILESMNVEEKQIPKNTNNINQFSKNVVKDVAVETNTTCRNCILVRKVLADLLGKISCFEKDKQKEKDVKLIQIDDKSSNSSKMNIISNALEESVCDLIQLSSTRCSARMMENEIGCTTSVDPTDVRNALASFLERNIETINEDVEENISSVVHEFLAFNNSVRVQSDNKQEKRNIVFPGKGSSIFPWDNKYYKRCPLCPPRQTLEHFMLAKHESVEESNEEVDEEENEDYSINENSGLTEGQEGNLIESENEENNDQWNIVEESDLNINGENVVNEEEGTTSSGSSNTEDEDQSVSSTQDSIIVQVSANPSYCTICDKQFSSPRGLNVHKGKSKMHKDLVLTTRGMAELIVSNNNSNISNNFFKCNSPGCDATFETSEQLKRHKLRLHTIKNFICECGKSYVKEGGLNKHKINCPRRN